MRTPQDRPADAGSTRAESQASSTSVPVNESTRQSTQQTGDVARPVPVSSEGRVSRAPRGWVSPFRAGFATNPWEMMRTMSEEFDRLFDDFAGLRSGLAPFGFSTPRVARGSDYRGTQPTAWAPQIEVIQKPNALVLQADLPGLKPEEVDVSVEDGVLTISGERNQEHKEEREGYLRSERSYGQFYRAIPLPDGADESNVKATFKNGVLEINLPLTERRKGRKIKVEG